MWLMLHLLVGKGFQECIELFTLSASTEGSQPGFLPSYRGIEGDLWNVERAAFVGPAPCFWDLHQAYREMGRILEDAMDGVSSAVPFWQASLLRQPEEVYDQQAPVTVHCLPVAESSNCVQTHVNIHMLCL